MTCSNKNNEKNKARKRKITWITPPPLFFNINVATNNVAKTFQTLIDKHLPKYKRLSKIFNRNTIKISYSCLPNVKQTISNNIYIYIYIYIYIIEREITFKINIFKKVGIKRIAFTDYLLLRSTFQFQNLLELFRG